MISIRLLVFTGKGITSGCFCSAIQRFSLLCILSQLSGEVFVALPIRTAISGLIEARSFKISDNVFLEMPRSAAALVTVKPNGIKTSSLSKFRVNRFSSLHIFPLLMIIIIQVIKRCLPSADNDVHLKNEVRQETNCNFSSGFSFLGHCILRHNSSV
jgi:hypothetical protein